jgi:hypothetical protein
MRTALLGAALTGLALWIAFQNLGLPWQDGGIFWIPVTLWLLTMGALCWWATAFGHQASSRAGIDAGWRAGWTLGGAGLALGFVGPLLLTPGANLGPLLGILVTGPLGFVVGVVGAALVRMARGAR